MSRFFIWLVIFGGIYFAYQAGLFNSLFNYFSDTAVQARKEQVIYHEDGSYTTVKYRNVIDLLFDKK